MRMKNVVVSAVLFLGFALTPALAIAQDNPSVTGQLNDARVIVNKIKKDAVQMQSYARANGLSWESHAAVLSGMKDDVNKLQANMRGLQSHRTIASPWQQDAIDRITSLANDLANTMNATINQLNNGKSRPTAPPYPEYLKQNARIVSDLADEINGTIDYGQAKASMDALQKQLSQ